MKVLQINSVSGFGSTGSICEDIAMALEEQGHDCYIAYGQLVSNYSKNFRIGTKLENHMHNIGSRLLGKQGYFTKTGTQKLITFINNYNPDVIHLHNLHGNYLNLPILFSFLKNFTGKIVYTLHDCWAFTGKCSHYTSVNCNKWQTECNACPQLQKYPPTLFFDKSNEMFHDKKQWFQNLPNLQIITVSNWLQHQVKLSFLKEKNIKTIYNWVDTTVFKPLISNLELVPETFIANKFTILCVSASWHKTDEKWIDLLKLAIAIPKDYQIIVIGNIEVLNHIPKNVMHIPYLSSKQKIAEIYNLANVYVHLSSEDTFGKVIAEALACGTPAIVYNSTACPEIIGENCGYVVEKGNITEILKSLKIIQTNSKEHYKNSCLAFVQTNFLKNVNINKTIKLYND